MDSTVSYTVQYRCKILREYGKPSDKSVDAGTKIFVVDTLFSGVHSSQRISNNIFEEWTDVDLTKDEAEGIAVRITKHNKFVARCRFINMEFVR